jgi:hypothetical protein
MTEYSATAEGRLLKDGKSGSSNNLSQPQARGGVAQSGEISPPAGTMARRVQRPDSLRSGVAVSGHLPERRQRIHSACHAPAVA